ncbi:hypothetical protein, partial [Streptomyces alfalfae]
SVCILLCLVFFFCFDGTRPCLFLTLLFVGGVRCVDETGGWVGAGAGVAPGTASAPPLGTPPRGAPRVPPKASLTDVVPRRTLVIVSVVAVLAVLGTVLAFALSGDDSGSGEDNKGGDKAASSGATAGDDNGKDGKGSDKGAGSGDGEDQAQGEGRTEDPGKGEDADEGQGHDPGKDEEKKPEDGAASTYKHDQGFKIGLPKGWKFQTTSRAGARFSGPDGQKLLVGWTTTPKDNPVSDWKNQENYMVRSQYDRIRIEKVDFRGWNTADWEFTYVDGGTKYRSVDRGFVVNSGLGYGLMYTAKADDWGGDQRRSAWKTFTRTFQPKS